MAGIHKRRIQRNLEQWSQQDSNLRPLACHVKRTPNSHFFAVLRNSLCDNEQQFSMNSKLFPTTAKNPKKPLHLLHSLHLLQVITRAERVITSGQQKLELENISAVSPNFDVIW